MKTIKHTFAFLLFSFSALFAQEAVKSKVLENNNINSPNSVQADGEMVTIKDGTKTMVEFVSRGSSGLISLPSLGTLVSYPGNNLYASGVDLYWGSVKLGTSSSAAGWSYSGVSIYTTTLSNKVGIGTNNPQSKLSVGGLGNTSSTISGEATTGWGIYGKATTGRGVYGFANGTSGRGVSGSASGDYGRGVFGSANGTGGEGVIAEAHGENCKAISGYASGSNGLAGNFVGDVTISGLTIFNDDVEISGSTTISENIEISGSAKLGTTGTPFLEIREISGTTSSSGNATFITNGLPLNWTGNKTHVLSLEIYWCWVV